MLIRQKQEFYCMNTVKVQMVFSFISHNILFCILLHNEVQTDLFIKRFIQFIEDKIQVFFSIP